MQSLHISTFQPVEVSTTLILDKFPCCCSPFAPAMLNDNCYFVQTFAYSSTTVRAAAGGGGGHVEGEEEEGSRRGGFCIHVHCQRLLLLNVRACKYLCECDWEWARVNVCAHMCMCVSVECVCLCVCGRVCVCARLYLVLRSTWHLFAHTETCRCYTPPPYVPPPSTNENEQKTSFAHFLLFFFFLFLFCAVRKKLVSK